jgi:uncharacterized membrane protein (Fun14 family)
MERQYTSPMKRELPWLLAGIVLASVWFAANRMLPPLFRGDVCCDSTQYVSMSESKKLDDLKPVAESPQAPVTFVKKVVQILFTDTGYRTIGYPAFLAIHRFVFGHWFVLASTITALLLHILAMFALYRMARSIGIPLHPVALTLLIAYPAFTSAAALPLSDSLAISLVLFGLCAMTKRGLGFALLTGLLFALAFWVRPAHLLPMTGVLGAWMIVGLFSKKKLWLPPLLALLTFCVLLSPRAVSCSRTAGSLCLMPAAESSVQQSTLFRLAMRGARTYTVIFKDARSEILTIPDPFLMRHFSSCPIGDSAPTKDLVLCLTKNTLRLPVFFLKKAIGLFDHFHWNTYATYVTPTWMIVMQRIIGSLGFSGFLGIPFVVGYAMHKKRRVTQVLVILVFPLLSFAMTSVIAIESRYGMAVMPFGMISAVLIGQWILKRRDKKAMLVAGLLSLLILTFLLQTLQWDLLDAFPRIPLILAT